MQASIRRFQFPVHSIVNITGLYQTIVAFTAVPLLMYTTTTNHIKSTDQSILAVQAIIRQLPSQKQSIKMNNQDDVLR